jgi:O-antigen/teichoic acid export membrane protein
MPSESTSPRHDAAVGRSFLKLGTGEAVARLIAFGATVYLARRLGADVYGTIALATAILLYLACVTDCGIEMLGISDVARQPSGIAGLLPSILVARLVVAAILVVVVTGAGLFLLPQPDGALLAGYALTLVGVALGTQWVHLGLERAGRVALVRVGGEAFSALLIVLLVRGPGDAAGAPLAQVIGQSAGAFILLRLLPDGAAALRVSLRIDVVASVFRRSWPLVLHALLGLAIFNSDFLFLRVFRDSASVGYYAVAYTLVSFFLNLGVSYSMGLLPVLARLKSVPEDERRLHDSAMAQVFAAALPVTIGGCLLAHQFIAVLFGSGYERAALALSILIWSIPFALFRNVAQAVLISHDRQRQLLRTVGVAAGFNLLLNLALIPRWGMIGAAVATLATEAVRTAVVLGYSRAAGLPFTTMRRFWRAGLAGAAMAAVLQVSRVAPWWAAMLLGAMAYGAALTLLGGLRFRRGARPELAV